ncbi:protein retrieval receptor [Pneumocystis jirovecii RU7]|uniref:Protein RER1 n=1 Tax=Pneumocystis jirovecii (strain RU7) TaxID=1408657 RepID=A0A0W4ZVZ9_PNEJ7|nr:protein retrieval receptor [Pneumocystis jirovecii RU7]KTW32554.1 hypothetical protein T551_00039 [Pneumocystis jirovecii RU7]
MDTDDLMPPETLVNIFSTKKNRFAQQYQAFLDQSTPYKARRWLSSLALLVLFMVRILVVQGWYIVCYALGIYLLNLFLAFLTPKLDLSLEQDLQENDDTEVRLPIRQDEEFRPFIRRLPEFKFWYSATRAIIIAFVCSWISFFDIPVFWPILLMYFCILFAFTMRRQIKHMIKYRYVPFDIGKKRFSSK